MTVKLINVEQELKGLIYNKLEEIKNGTIEFNVDIISNEFIKLDGGYIYMGKEDKSITPLNGKFNCRIIEKKNDGGSFETNAKGVFYVDYDNLNCKLIYETLDCSFEK